MAISHPKFDRFLIFKKNHICFENTPCRSPTIHGVEYIIISNQKRGGCDELTLRYFFVVKVCVKKIFDLLTLNFDLELRT